MADQLDITRSHLLADVPHGFLGRAGGVSTGDVAGLQFGQGAGDDPARVAANRRSAIAAIQPDAELAMPYQVHSPDAVVVREVWDDADRPRADAVVTDRPGLLLGVVTADCAPVLLADSQAGIVAAAHAGWRGAHGGVIESTLEMMEKLGAEASRIAAAIGPCIGQDNYEVDAPFRTHFSVEDERHFIAGRQGHWQFDLEGYVASRLQSAGIARIDPLELDTYALPDRFYSFRRATHSGAANYGRQASLIGLPAIVA
ncbi:peptidoglycan editing factor PgeF [Parerythrobacter jejuensis]|uniref:Purine nucleoside phosphorylase n=1 Tax=Parerythrobacter jejuensis TaxID=795812 RepID=A0A845AVI2_9SPHN|nr:peptidoglycan editing factor PgeF [Parerythrobacter jejuensis]MXP30824.1 peptidoglycan editing factor PgeF [Parerythrobacter jejuensis]MXP33584.1 peptidoglycan editing factor PgeF [Parerythrobacter jejuensis]